MNTQRGSTTNTLLIIILILVVGFVVWELADGRGRGRGGDDRGAGIEIELGDDNGGDSGNRGPQ